MQHRIQCRGVQPHPHPRFVGRWGGGDPRQHRIGAVRRQARQTAERRAILQAGPVKRGIKIARRLFGRPFASPGPGRVGRWCRSGEQPRQRHLGPAAARSPPRLDRQTSRRGFPPQAQRRFRLGDLDRAQKIEIAHLWHPLGVDRTGHRAQHLDHRGRGQQAAPPDPVIGQPRHPRQRDRAGPDRNLGVDAEARQRMRALPAEQVDPPRWQREIAQLQRRGWQAALPGPARAQQAGLVHRAAHHQHPAHHGVDVAHPRGIQRLDDRQRMARLVGDVAQIAAQQAAGGDLDAKPDPVGQHRGHGGAEGHRLAGVPPPVAGIKRHRILPRPHAARIERHLRGPPADMRQIGQQAIVQRIDRGAVIGIGDGQQLAGQPPAPGQRQHLFKRGNRTAEGDRGGGVLGRDADRLAALGDQRPGLGDRCGQGRHPAGAMQRPEGPPARSHDAHGFGPGDPARGNRGGDLAQRMAQNGGGAQAGLGQGLDQPALDGEMQRLRQFRPFEGRPRRGRQQKAPQRHVADRAEVFRDGVERVAEAAVRQVDVARDPVPQRTIAGKHEGHRQIVPKPALAGLRQRLRIRAKPGQIGLKGRGRGQGQAQPPGMARPPPVGIGHRLRQRRAVVGHPAPGQGGAGQRLGAGGRQQQRRRQRVRCGRGRAVGGIGLADHRMGIGPAKAERADRRRPGPIAPGDRTGLAHDLKVQAGEIDCGIEPLGMKRGRDQPAIQRKLRLQQPHQPRGGFQMAEIGLGRPDRQRPCAVLAIGAAQGLGLGRVAHQRAGAMRLGKGQILGVDAEAVADLFDQAALPPGRRQRDPVGATVAVHPGADQDRAQPQPLGPGQIGALKHEHHRALGPDIAVGAFGKGLAQPVGRQHSGLREAHEGHGRQKHVDRPHNRRVDGSRGDGLAGAVKREQPRRAGGVHGIAGAAEIPLIRDPVRQNRQCVAQHEMRADRLGVLCAVIGIIRPRGADKDPGPVAVEPGRIDPRIVEGRGGGAQQKPLLGVHLLGLARGDAEMAGVEGKEIGNDSGGAGAGAARDGRAGMVEAHRRETPGRDRGDRTIPGCKPQPCSARAVSAGKKASTTQNSCFGLRQSFDLSRILSLTPNVRHGQYQPRFCNVTCR